MAADILTILTAAVVTGLLAFWPRLASSRVWLATVTPLASIMGSGFLVCAPLLARTVGYYAAPAMAVLLLLAYAIGAVARFNIRHAEPLSSGGDEEEDAATDHRNYHGHRRHVMRSKKGGADPMLRRLEATSQGLLAIAYIISVTYYLKLLAVFVLRGLSGDEPSASLAATVATGVLLLIAGIGAVRGLKLLEKVEKYAVALNLGMIAALLSGLVLFNVRKIGAGEWELPPLVMGSDPFTTARILLGLLIVVQGFETSLYLGAEHSAEERIVTMRRAQWISTAIYLVFLSLLTVLFGKIGEGGGVTEVVALSGYVAVVLPVMIIIAAAGSQFSAAVADDSGCAGLLSQLLPDKLSMRWIYLGIGSAAILLTWLTDVTQIISIASRAFAAYYAVQCGIAAHVATVAPDVNRRRARFAGYLALCAVCLLVAVLGISAG